MNLRKATSLWIILALGATIASGLAIPQLDNDDLDCEPWDAADEVDLYPSAFPVSRTATILSGPLESQASSTRYPSPTTIVTSVRIAQASSTGIASSTNTFVAPTDSFIPVTPPSYAFYLQSNGNNSSSGLYAAVSAGADGSVTFTANKDSATKFTIDSSGDLVEQSPSQGYVATLNPETNDQKVEFNAYGGSSSPGRLNCQRGSGVLSCNVGGVAYYAATCGSDGTLYFAKTLPSSCTAIDLVPIFP